MKMDVGNPTLNLVGTFKFVAKDHPDFTNHTAIDIILNQINEKIEGRSSFKNVYLLDGRTGSGKSTLFIAKLLERFNLKIIVSEPRIVLTKANAFSVSEFNKELLLGTYVGYKNSTEVLAPSNATSITYMTTQLVVNQLQVYYQFFTTITEKMIIVVDEAHLMDIQTLDLLKEIKQFLMKHGNNHLCPLFILQSATIRIEEFARYFFPSNYEGFINDWTSIGRVIGKPNFDVVEKFITRDRMQEFLRMERTSSAGIIIGSFYIEYLKHLIETSKESPRDNVNDSANEVSNSSVNDVSNGNDEVSNEVSNEANDDLIEDPSLSFFGGSQTSSPISHLYTRIPREQLLHECKSSSKTSAKSSGGNKKRVRFDLSKTVVVDAHSTIANANTQGTANINAQGTVQKPVNAHANDISKNANKMFTWSMFKVPANASVKANEHRPVQKPPKITGGNYFRRFTHLLFIPYVRGIEECGMVISKALEKMNIPVHMIHKNELMKDLDKWRYDVRAINKNQSRVIIVPIARNYAIASDKLLNGENTFDYINESLIFISTNIVETGKTIKDLTFALDSGFDTVACFNPLMFDINMYGRYLLQIPESKSKAVQRLGRIGRECSGEFLHFMSKDTYDMLDDYELPDTINAYCISRQLMEIAVRTYLWKQYDFEASNIYLIKFTVDILINSFADLLRAGLVTPFSEIVNLSSTKFDVDFRLYTIAKYLHYIEHKPLRESLIIASITERSTNVYLEMDYTNYQFKDINDFNENMLTLDIVTQLKRANHILMKARYDVMFNEIHEVTKQND